MGVCTSCMKILLDAENDVRINVIEPTTMVGGEQSVAGNPISNPPIGPLLTVPQNRSLRPNV
uniref:SDR family oxidoreductase n=1 Tax=Rhabditophanes sp. KR3021 TaxID=114890 RepID=A0AC35U5W5_9BILA